MGSLEGLLFGFSVCFAPTNILAVFVGALVGTLIGVLPGIGPIGAIALLLPMTFKMDPTTSLIMLAGIYFGSMYGGSTTSILVNVPGEVCAVVTCIDGYEMAKKGRAGAALAVAAVGSFIAGTLGVVGVMFLAPTLAQFALSFGPPEYFAITLLALFILPRISGGAFWQSLLVMTLGLVLGTIGLDPTSGTLRYTFGLPRLSQGIDLVPVVMGLYGLGEMLHVAEEAGGLPRAAGIRFRELFPTTSEWRRALPAIFRGSGLGFFWGLIPGPSTVISTFGSYRLEQRLSKHREDFGHGAIEGVAGPESANNAAGTGAMIPLLSLGIPFTPVVAMLLAALMIQGVQPGPRLITERPEIFWGVIASFYVGNMALLILNLPLIGIWVSVLRIPQSILQALVILLCLVGAYSINNSLLDLVVLVVMGGVGYISKKINFDMAPMILGLVLGSMLEVKFIQSLYLDRGNLLIFFQRPISGFFIIVLFLVLVVPPIWRLVTRRRRLAPKGSTSERYPK
jgi:putative tricarboxylic transport membrane protein